MNQEQMIDLARRAVACKGWRWMPGMLHGMVVGGKLTSCYRIGDLTLCLDADRVPDFTDPATLGCLLALVQEAWNNNVVITIGNGWFQIETDVRDWDGNNTSSLLLALVFALEIAPYP